MATVSFNNKKEKTVEVKAEVVSETKATAPVERTLANAAQKIETEEGFVGELSHQDIKLPRINLVQKVGDLSNLFTPGSILFNKEVILSEPGKQFEATVLRIKKQYQQDLPYGSEETALTFDTVEEVYAAGGSTKYNDDNFYKEIAHVQLVIKKPEDCPEELEDLFAHEFEGNSYAVTIWTFSSSAYKSAGKTLITAYFTLLKRDLSKGKWVVSSEIRKNNKSSWYVPIFKFAGKHTPEAHQFFSKLAQ